MNNTTELNSDELWAKAFTSESITREDLGIHRPRDNSGLRLLNEGVGYMKTPCKDCDYYHKENNTCQSKKCGSNSIGHISILDRLFCKSYKAKE